MELLQPVTQKEIKYWHITAGLLMNATLSPCARKCTKVQSWSYIPDKASLGLCLGLDTRLCYWQLVCKLFKSSITLIQARKAHLLVSWHLPSQILVWMYVLRHPHRGVSISLCTTIHEGKFSHLLLLTSVFGTHSSLLLWKNVVLRLKFTWMVKSFVFNKKETLLLCVSRWNMNSIWFEKSLYLLGFFGTVCVVWWWREKTISN